MAENDEPGAAGGQPEDIGHPEATGTPPPSGEPDEPADQGDDTGDDDEEPLLSDEEFEKVKGDPAALRAAITRAHRSRVQQFEPLMRLAQALEEDPQGTLTKLAEQAGHRLVPAQGDDDGKPSILEAAYNALVAANGKEAADSMFPAIRAISEAIVEQRVGPIRESVQETAANAAASQARSTLDRMTKAYPDWKKYEKEMIRLKEVMPPGEDADMYEYTENLYFLASSRAREAGAARKVAERMGHSANAGGERRPTGVPSGKVHNKPPAKPSFEEAFEAAKRGERFEYD